MLIGIIVGSVCGLLLLLIIIMGYTKAGPDEAIMISGLGKSKILIGKAGFRFPFLQRKDKLHLKAFQVDVKTNEAIPTKDYVNITVDAVANLKISDQPEILKRAFQSLLCISEADRAAQVQQVLQGNLREIIGTVSIEELVRDRQNVATQVTNNVIPDMAKLGIELINFNIQNFNDDDNVIINLGAENIANIAKQAAIAKALAEKDVTIAQAEAHEIANKAKVDSSTKILTQNTELSLKESELKQKADTARAVADAAYSIEQQKRQSEINIAEVNANIAKREREVDLGNKEVELKEKKLNAEVNKVADAEKYRIQMEADADLYSRQKAAEAEKYELQQKAEMKKIEAEAEMYAKSQAAEALKIEAEAKKQAALDEAMGIKAKGEAEAEAILKKAEAMKQYGEAATLQLILESDVLPKVVEAYSKPMAEALSHIDSITMYGEGNTAKLNEEITKNGTQIFDGLEKATGLDIKSLLAGYLGGRLIDSKKDNTPVVIEKTVVEKKVPVATTSTTTTKK